MTKGMVLITICCLLLAAPMCAEGAEGRIHTASATVAE